MEGERRIRELWRRGFPIPDSEFLSAGYERRAVSRFSTEIYGRRAGEIGPYSGRHGTGWTRVESAGSRTVEVSFWTRGAGTVGPGLVCKSDRKRRERRK